MRRRPLVAAAPRCRQRNNIVTHTQNMTIKYFANIKLPRLAWLASVNRITGECCVEHGCLVETREEFFVEGVWAGSFAEGGFHRCESFFGSGAVRTAPGEIVFIPSSATVDYLYYKETLDGIVCSNSLPLLLAARNDRLDEFNREYTRINESITKGIKHYEQRIPTRRGSVRRLMYHNMVVRDGEVRQEAKPLPPEFGSFEQYRSYLAGNIAGMMQNARERSRGTPLRILSTQSTGYDSTAINSIARDYSLDLALSISESKERRLYFKHRPESTPSDSGQKIGSHLGIEVCSIDRRFFQKDPENEYLYWAGLHNCQDMNLHQVREHVGDGAVLLSGVLGELWYNATSTPPNRLATVNDQLERWDLGCHSLSEVRLHIGYVHAPAPYIGARRRKNLFDLANSKAMRPWSIGGGYDRPIARRIGEDAGIPRALFGQTKLATIVEFMPPYLPHGAPLRREFFRFFRQTRGVLRLFHLSLAPSVNTIMWKVFDTVRRTRFAPTVIKWMPARRTIGSRFNGVLYAYCVNKTARFYDACRHPSLALIPGPKARANDDLVEI
jgi:hypothetical protein